MRVNVICHDLITSNTELLARRTTQTSEFYTRARYGERDRERDRETERDRERQRDSER